jgi:hypothetical protein
MVLKVLRLNTSLSFQKKRRRGDPASQSRPPPQPAASSAAALTLFGNAVADGNDTVISTTESTHIPLPAAHAKVA